MSVWNESDMVLGMTQTGNQEMKVYIKCIPQLLEDNSLEALGAEAAFIAFVRSHRSRLAINSYSIYMSIPTKPPLCTLIQPQRLYENAHYPTIMDESRSVVPERLSVL